MALWLMLGIAPVQARPRAVLFLCSAASIRDIQQADAPHLQALMKDGGVAVMTVGLPGTDRPRTLTSDGYVPVVSLPSGEPPRLTLADHLRGHGGLAYVGCRHDSLMAQGGRVYTGPDLHPGGPARPDAAAYATHLRGMADRSGVLIVSARPNPDVELTRDAFLALIAAEDRVLGVVRSILPDVPVLALCPDPILPDGVRGGSHLSIPSWMAASDLGGGLTSATTRTPGIVSSLDVAPTLAALAGAPMSGARGHVLSGVTMADPLDWAVWRQSGLVSIAYVTLPIIVAYAAFIVLLLLAGSVLCLVRRGAWAVRMRRAVQWGLIVVIVAPMALALVAAALPSTQLGYLAMAIPLTLVLAILNGWLGRVLATSREDATLATLFLSVGVVATFVFSDTLSHNVALRLSPLDPLFLMPIRFYGLGNTYAALFITAVVVSGLVAVQRYGVKSLEPKGLALLGAWFLAACALVGWPTAGANFGGLAASIVACGTAWWLAARRSGVRAGWVWPLLAGIALVAAVLWADTHSAQATHVGQFVQSSPAGNAGRLGIILTKIRMNLSLLARPAVLGVLLAAVVYLWMWAGPLARVRRRVHDRFPWVALALPSVAAGAVAAFLLNDTGVVMLAVMSAGLAVVWLYLALEPMGLAVVGPERPLIE